MRRAPIIDAGFWLALAVPAIIYLARASGMEAADLEDLLHPTGELSARLLIAALTITPLALLFPENGLPKWLRRQRRAIGLAAFGYALLHLIFYAIAMGDVQAMLAELGATGIWTGWVAIALMVPLAATSSNAAMRALGRNWKRLQRLAYAAAVLTLIHWLAIHDGSAGALVHFAPLAALELTRIFRRRSSVAASA